MNTKNYFWNVHWVTTDQSGAKSSHKKIKGPLGRTLASFVKGTCKVIEKVVFWIRHSHNENIVLKQAIIAEAELQKISCCSSIYKI